MVVTVIQDSVIIINQYEAVFDSTGTAKFQTLGFYSEATDVTIKYTLHAQTNIEM